MKTAMQELIIILKEHADLTQNLRVKQAYLNSICAIEDFKLLEKEKQQIIDSANHGVDFKNSPFKNAEDYYNETFKL